MVKGPFVSQICQSNAYCVFRSKLYKYGQLKLPSLRLFTLDYNVACSEYPDSVSILLTDCCVRGKFLKKLWCSVGGEYYTLTWFYQLG